MDKFYIYVDESGQDTRGSLFVVDVVIVVQNRDEVESECEDAEKVSGKGKIKWRDAHHCMRLDFVRIIFQNPLFRNTLNAVIYENKGTDYLQLTAQGISTAIRSSINPPYEATVFIDGLPRSRQKPVGAMLRKLGVKVRKVRGVKKDENNVLIRLAVAGLMREVHKGRSAETNLLKQGKTKGVIKEIEG